MSTLFKPASLQTLLGNVLGHPIYEYKGAPSPLLEAGSLVTAAVVEGWEQRGIFSVFADERDSLAGGAWRPRGTATEAPPDRLGIRARLATAASRQLDWAVDEGGALELTASGPPFVEQLRSRQDRPYALEVVARFADEHKQAVTYLDELFTELVVGKVADVVATESVCRDALQRATEDFDLFVCLGINALTGKYPVHHSLNVATIATAIGIAMGLDEAALVNLGQGCLLHDVGMLQVALTLYEHPRRLNDDEFLEVAAHPLKSLDLVEAYADRLPLSARLIVYQMHERCDGSGYPRGRLGQGISPLAKIAAVADTFVALVTPRPHRAGLLPYHAVEHILRGVKAGRFDSVVTRGLLWAVSLFPIGSLVALDADRVGRVIRANGYHYDRPVIHVWRAEATDAAPQTVNLLHDPQLKISKPLASLPSPP